MSLTMSLLMKNTNYIHMMRVYSNGRRSIFTSVPNYEDDEFFQVSKLPTMYFQPSLPRLPIPKLEDSFRRYLKAQQPILSEDEWRKTSENVAHFLANDGPILQNKLIEEDSRNKHTSYISDLWFDMYLRDRKPLPINYNPLLVMVQEDNVSYNKPIVKGTNLLISSARFMKSLRAGILEPEVYHANPEKSDTEFFRSFTKLLPKSIATYGAYFLNAYPLDMSQYKNLFGTTRIPNIGKDTLRHDYISRHIIVMRRGYFYSMDLLNSNGTIRTPIEIATSLKTIMEDPREPNPSPIGVMTAADRDEWAKVRQHLINIGNENVLNKIDSAAFIFIIDEECVESEYNKIVRMFLHSDAKNRWFDKSFSLIMAGDGIAGINFEHSWGDGVAILRYFKSLKNDIAKKPRFHPSNENEVSTDASSVEKLKFVVDDFVKETINRIANEYHDLTMNKLTVDNMINYEFGKPQCKKFGISPDAIMQLTFQLALYKREKRAVATYESCSTAAFRHGRTETVRSCTNETKALCVALMENNSRNNQELKKKIIECSKAHSVLIREAAMGQGFDRHLFALKKQWEKLGSGDIPKIFSDPAYAKINHNILSTSTLASPEVLSGGFGPVVEDGYGIGYMIIDRGLGTVITSYRPHRDASEYVQYLKSAFDDISKVMNH